LGACVKVKPRDAYHLGASQVDDELYHECMPANIRKEKEFRDPMYWANLAGES